MAVKIGELSQLCNVPQATIRYYVHMGMLVPDDSGAQYNFSDREYQDLQLILRMKRQRFSLKEIQDYLVLTRHSNFIEPDTIEACRRLWDGKRQEINAQIAQLQKSLQDIDREILELSHRADGNVRQTGLPLSAVSVLVCPHCGRGLAVDNASIHEDYIYSGLLRCGNLDCPHGYQAIIEHGIVKTENRYTAPYDSPDLTRGLYRNMVPSFSLAQVKCSDFMCGELEKQPLHGKVILESNINGYFFLYRHLNLIPEDCLCIVTDKFPEMLEMYKSLIEQMGVKNRILYIADAGERFPLRPGCVDILINYFGDNEYQLYHKHSFIADAKRYLKSNAKILGAYISYDRDSLTRKNLKKKYPECYDRLDQAEYLREDYQAAGFHIEMAEAGETTDSGTYQYSFSCHVRGEPLRVFRLISEAN